MAKTKTEQKKIEPIYLEGGKYEEVPLEDVNGNTGQSRKTGVLPILKKQGYGLFEKEGDNPPLKDLLLSDDVDERKKSLTLIRETDHDDEDHDVQSISSLAESINQSGLLEPIGLLKDGDDYNIIFGGRRYVAFLCNYAEDPDSAPETIPAMVWEVDNISDEDLLLLSLKENRDRMGESPIDLGMSFLELRKAGYPDKEIGEFLGKSHQYVKNYCFLLDTKLKDKRELIQTRKMSVDAALKLLKKRKEGKGDEEDDRTEPAGGKDRNRFPPMKRLETAYNSREKPEWMEDEEFEMFQDSSVRKFIAHYCGFKFVEFDNLPKPKKAKSEEKPGKNGKAEKEDSVKTTKVVKGQAQRMFIALGKTDARTWDNAKLKEACEAIVNYAEPKQDLSEEGEGVDKLLRKLEKAYKEGTKVVISD